MAQTKAAVAKAQRDLTNSLKSADQQEIVRAENLLESATRGLEVLNKYFPILFPETK